MPTEMLINFVPGEECRIAIVENGKLEEYYQERASAESHVSNIYKGRVTNTEPSIQAAFVDFGLERNGFLHISDLHPKYFPGKEREAFEKVGKKTARRDRPPIQKCLKRGDEVLVQVLKEGIGTKGPTLTSYLSIPGRFLVMMPDMQKLGVSRKVDDDDARRATRDILQTLDPPKEFGFIVRTAGIGQTKTDLKRDLSYLQRLWKNIEQKRKTIKRTGELYAESDLVIRTIRDVFTSDIDRIVIDDLTAARRARDFLRVASPRTKTIVQYYDDPVPLFHRTGVEPQIDLINAREVPLPSGGALVIDQTEALVAIDVNSGKSRSARDAETNAFKTNMEAVDEICRQLRLRDLGGIVVNDLIDMRLAGNRKKVEARMRDNLKKDRARSRIGPISGFGLLEMTRQRMRASLRKSLHTECSHCSGLGYTMSSESVVLTVMRRLALVVQRQDVARVELTISPDVAFQLLNRKRMELTRLEEKHGKPILVRVGGRTIDYITIAAYDARNTVLNTDPQTNIKNLRPATDKTFRDVDDPDLPETAAPALVEDDPMLDQPEAEHATDEDGLVDVRASVEAENRARSGDDAGDGSGEEGGKKKRRRRRRGGRKRKSGGDGEGDADGSSQQTSESPAGSDDADKPADDESANQSSVPHTGQDAKPEDTGEGDGDDDGEGTKKKRRRRRRGGRKRNKKSAQGEASDAEQAQDTNQESRTADKSDAASSDDASPDDAPKKKAKADDSADQSDDYTAKTTKKKTKRTRRRTKSTKSKDGEQADSSAEAKPADPAEKTTPKADGKDDASAAATKPSKKKRVRKRNAPPPPGEAPSGGYSNRLTGAGRDRE
ncbi:MAG: ribonuclease E/G [Phycisphaerales bacterium JB063]